MTSSLDPSGEGLEMTRMVSCGVGMLLEILIETCQVVYISRSVGGRTRDDENGVMSSWSAIGDCNRDMLGDATFSICQSIYKWRSRIRALRNDQCTGSGFVNIIENVIEGLFENHYAEKLNDDVIFNTSTLNIFTLLVTLVVKHFYTFNLTPYLTIT